MLSKKRRRTTIARGGKREPYCNFERRDRYFATRYRFVFRLVYKRIENGTTKTSERGGDAKIRMGF